MATWFARIKFQWQEYVRSYFECIILPQQNLQEKYWECALWWNLKGMLYQVVDDLEAGLDSKVIDNGGNFGIGQKQLIWRGPFWRRTECWCWTREEWANWKLQAESLIICCDYIIISFDDWFSLERERERERELLTERIYFCLKKSALRGVFELFRKGRF